MNPEGFLLVEGHEGVKQDHGGVCRCVGKGLRWGEGRGREGGVFLDGGVGEGEGGLDVKGEEGHFDIGDDDGSAGEGKEETKAGERQSDGVIKWERVSTLWTWTKDQKSAITVSHCRTREGHRNPTGTEIENNQSATQNQANPGRGHPRPMAQWPIPGLEHPINQYGHYPDTPIFQFIFPCYPSPSSSSSPSPQYLSRYGPGSCTIVSSTLLYLNPPSSTEPPSFQTPPATSAFSLRRVFKPTLIHLSRPHTSQTPSTNWLSIHILARVPRSGSHRPSKQ